MLPRVRVYHHPTVNKQGIVTIMMYLTHQNIVLVQCTSVSENTGHTSTIQFQLLHIEFGSKFAKNTFKRCYIINSILQILIQQLNSLAV